MNILIDSREKGSSKLENTRRERAQEYYEKKNHTTKVQQLPYGDYCFDDTVVWEYKTVSDFITSVSNKSVFEEVANQTMNYDYSYLIIVGKLSDYIQASYYQRGYKYREYDKWLFQITNQYYGAIRRLRTYCNVITVKTEEKAFLEMLLQSKKCLNPKHYGGGKRSTQVGDVLIDSLIGADGVSFKLIETLLKTLRIPNLYCLLECKEEDFQKVPLIGEKKAHNIYEHLHKQRKY